MTTVATTMVKTRCAKAGERRRGIGARLTTAQILTVAPKIGRQIKMEEASGRFSESSRVIVQMDLSDRMVKSVFCAWVLASTLETTREAEAALIIIHSSELLYRVHL